MGPLEFLKYLQLLRYLKNKVIPLTCVLLFDSYAVAAVDPSLLILLNIFLIRSYRVRKTTTIINIAIIPSRVSIIYSIRCTINSATLLSLNTRSYKISLKKILLILVSYSSNMHTINQLYIIGIDYLYK